MVRITVGMPQWIRCKREINFSRQPNMQSMLHSPLGFVRSRTSLWNGRCCSLHFSRMTLDGASTVPPDEWNPHCYPLGGGGWGGPWWRLVANRSCQNWIGFFYWKCSWLQHLWNNCLLFMDMGNEAVIFGWNFSQLHFRTSIIIPSALEALLFLKWQWSMKHGG